MYIFGVSSISHLAAVSVVKCTVIVRPLTYFTIFASLNENIAEVALLKLGLQGTMDALSGWITSVTVVEETIIGVARLFAAERGGTRRQSHCQVGAQDGRIIFSHYRLKTYEVVNDQCKHPVKCFYRLVYSHFSVFLMHDACNIRIFSAQTEQYCFWGCG